MHPGNHISSTCLVSFHTNKIIIWEKVPIITLDFTHSCVIRWFCAFLIKKAHLQAVNKLNSFWCLKFISHKESLLKPSVQIKVVKSSRAIQIMYLKMNLYLVYHCCWNSFVAKVFKVKLLSSNWINHKSSFSTGCLIWIIQADLKSKDIILKKIWEHQCTRDKNV